MAIKTQNLFKKHKYHSVYQSYYDILERLFMTDGQPTVEKDNTGKDRRYFNEMDAWVEDRFNCIVEYTRHEYSDSYILIFEKDEDYTVFALEIM